MDFHIDELTEALWDATDAAILVSSDGRVRYANPAFTRLTGIAVQDAVGQAVDTLPLGSASSRTSKIVEWRGEALVVSTLTPRADIQALEDALSRRTRQYHELFEDDSTGRFVVSPDWVIRDANTALARMLGSADRSDLVGRSLLSLSPDGPILQKLMAVTRVERRAGPADVRLERKDGELIDVSCSVAGSFAESGSLASVLGQAVEITERKRLANRLVGAERMEVIGRLAGGLAHDFNNLLTVITGNTERLLDVIPDHDPLRGAASAIHDASARATSMTQQLLAFARRQVFELQPLSLQHLVSNAQPTLARALGEHIIVRLLVLPDIPQISADPRQIEHVLANLAHNAREAMPSGGVVTIRVDTIEIDENAPRQRLWLRPGRYVRLVFADTGVGMDPVTRSHAFQPFFTTKRIGNGRGLGLATVYGIVKQSHGFVWVEGEVGKGATFTLLFPAIKAEHVGSAPASRPADETVLVVEGDDVFRGFVREALSRRGYEVLEAPTADAALDVFASHPSQVHLVVCDVGAITADGAPLLERLQAIDPMAQALIVIDSSDEVGGRRRSLPTTPVIQRPFTLQALARKVREVLDSGEGRG